MTSLLLLALASTAVGQSAPTGLVRIHLEPTVVEHAIDEFDRLCLRTGMKPDAVISAVGSSNSGYKLTIRKSGGKPWQWWWQSTTAIIQLSIPTSRAEFGLWLPQCIVTVDTSVPRSKKELLTLLEPSLRAALGVARSTSGGRMIFASETPGTDRLVEVNALITTDVSTTMAAFSISTVSSAGYRLAEQVGGSPNANDENPKRP